MSDQKEASLEERLTALEDRLAIYQAVCGYGYAVDGCNADAVGSFYAEDGVYAVGDTLSFEGRERIAGITRGKIHLGYVNAGCAHMATLPYVVIDGDQASATCNMILPSRSEDSYYIARLAATRSALSRKPDGSWQIDHRQNHQLDGGQDAPKMLARLNEKPKSGHDSPAD